MLLSFSGRFGGTRFVSSSSSYSLTCTRNLSPFSSSWACMLSSSEGASMSLQVPDLSFSLPSSPQLKQCYFPYKYSVPSPRRFYLPIRSVMTERQDNSNGAPHSYEQDAPVRNNLREMNIYLWSYKSGVSIRAMCPMCDGGSSKERSLSVSISVDGSFAKWQCFRASCGWKGYTEAPRNSVRANCQVLKDSRILKRDLSEENIRLQDLSAAQLEYLDSRGISQETLNRNGVKQLRKGLKSLLAFPYREGGEIVSCKYYTSDLEFEEEKCVRKIFYGLDDIKGASQIIIVGHELDKLALEEAGFYNCVSVPDVPNHVRTKVSERKIKIEASLQDKKFEYLWNCQDQLAKVDSFILATGSDERLENLAEELARRLGRERCWRVNWPSDKNGVLCKGAHTGLWNWQRYGDGPNTNLSLEADGDFTREIGYLHFRNFNNPPGKHDSYLNNVWFQPEEVFPVTGTPEVREHHFWVPVDKTFYKIAKKLESLDLVACLNATNCLTTTPKVVTVKRGVSANVFVDNAAYRGFLRKKFHISPIDMESASVSLVCLTNNVPFIAIRALSDLAGGSSEVNQIAIFANLAATNAVIVLTNFIKLI